MPVELSVVIPVRNRPGAAVVAIQSVLADAGTHALEVIVVDDGSTDDTGDRALSIGDSRVRVVRQEAAGVSAARNNGVRHARARFVAFLDSDDQVLPGWVTTMVAAGESGLDAFSCADVERYVDGHEHVIAPADLGPAFGGLQGRFQAGAFGLSTKAFWEAGGFVEGLRHGESTTLWMSLGRVHSTRPLRVGSTAQPLVVVYRRPRLYDAALYHESGRTTLEAVGDMLRRDRRALANHLSVTGVAAARLGRRSEAIGLLARAVRANPVDWRHLGRLGAAMAGWRGR